MRLSLFLAMVTCACLSASGASTGDGPVRAERLTFQGWKGCVALIAGRYRVVVAPSIGGRIVEYSVDGHGPIWTNPDERGKVHALDPKVWWNYGGYKTWPAPQADWGWPPDPLLDAAPAAVTVRRRAGRPPEIRIVGRGSVKSGVQFVKTVTLDPDGRLHLQQTMRAVSGRTTPVKWGLWDITQVTADGIVAIPLNPRSRHAGGVYFFSPEAQRSDQWSASDGVLLVRNRGQVTKYGVDDDAGWMAWFQDRLAYVKLFPTMEPGTDYPDENSSAQVYTNNPPLSYIEMEVTGPVSSLKPGDEVHLYEEWRLVDLPEPVTTNESALAAVQRLDRDGAFRQIAPPARR